MNDIVRLVKEQDYEFKDFKITFGVSIVAHLKKQKLMFLAESQFGTKVPIFEAGALCIDFKEVFKWITSPLLVQRLDESANLDGLFKIHCDFKNEQEDQVVRSLIKELESYGIMTKDKKRVRKWIDKRNKKDEKEEQKLPLAPYKDELEKKVLPSVEELLKRTKAMPKTLFQELQIFNDEISKHDLTTFLTVTCGHDSILLYGRYNKLNRKVSQTPWCVEGGHGQGGALSSVQCEISKAVVDIFKPAEGQVFLHAAGREDIDVRMLGTGRPFVFELMNPKRAISCAENVCKIKMDSPYVRCSGWSIVDKHFFDELKEI